MVDDDDWGGCCVGVAVVLPPANSDCANALHRALPLPPSLPPSLPRLTDRRLQLVLGVEPLRVRAAAPVLRLDAERRGRVPHALLAADARVLVYKDGALLVRVGVLRHLGAQRGHPLGQRLARIAVVLVLQRRLELRVVRGARVGVHQDLVRLVEQDADVVARLAEEVGVALLARRAVRALDLLGRRVVVDAAVWVWLWACIFCCCGVD